MPGPISALARSSPRLSPTLRIRVRSMAGGSGGRDPGAHAIHRARDRNASWSGRNQPGQHNRAPYGGNRTVGEGSTRLDPLATRLHNRCGRRDEFHGRISCRSLNGAISCQMQAVRLAGARVPSIARPIRAGRSPDRPLDDSSPSNADGREGLWQPRP